MVLQFSSFILQFILSGFVTLGSIQNSVFDLKNSAESSDQNNSKILTITTTSRSALWAPGSVVTDGQILEWKASADGMEDQSVLTSDIPSFDFSLPRNSDVTISVSMSGGRGQLLELIVNSLNITSITFEEAREMRKLSCTDNQIKKLNLQGLPNLSELFCHSNQLNELSVENNVQLSILACFSNQISSLRFENNPFLTSLSCSNNLLRTLNLNENAELSSLECRSNQMQSLFVKNGNNSMIVKFDTSDNPELLCIEVEDEEYSRENWKSIDEWTVFSEDCTFSNNPPIAVNDEYFSKENSILEIDVPEGVLANDSDPDEDILLAILVDDVEFGELVLFPDGSFIYEPRKDYSGVDSFTYKANDGEFDSNVAQVTIFIETVNAPPIALDDAYITEENKQLFVDESNGVLANDSDPDGDSLEAFLVDDVNNGSLVLNPNGSFTYSPNQDFYGFDKFTYQAFDGLDYSNVAEVILEVLPIHRIVAPNAFTPNGDQLNDTFRPVYVGMERVDLWIFDTWNTLIYHESGRELKGWDGLVRKKSAENGNYLYRIEALTREGKKIELEGVLTMIR